MTWLWIPHASSRSSTYECVGPLRTFHPLLTSRFTFQHLPAFVVCLFCVVVWFCCFGVFLFPVFALLCFWFLFCKCLGIPNSPRSLDLDDRQGLIARSAMQQKKKTSRSSRRVVINLGLTRRSLRARNGIWEMARRATQRVLRFPPPLLLAKVRIPIRNLTQP